MVKRTRSRARARERVNIEYRTRNKEVRSFWLFAVLCGKSCVIPLNPYKRLNKTYIHEM